MPGVKAAAFSAGDQKVIYEVRTMKDIVSGSMVAQRFPMMLLGTFAALALLLAAIGIYGVISYSMTQRVHEIGIRMALGASKANVFRMVLGNAIRLSVAGIILGLAAALALGPVVGSFSRLLYGVGAADPATLAATSLMLVSVALLACYFPARRAMRTDPMIALRHE
jgi:putative ABC transport system permease protein